MSGSTTRAAFALSRPPRHHAGANSFGGCGFLNNAALAAQTRRDHGEQRVAVLDVDYHHGNGTQAVFYARDDVLTVSIHGDPMTEYPFCLGHADERGAGAGTDFNLNLPLPRGTGFVRWLRRLARGAARGARCGRQVRRRPTRRCARRRHLRGRPDLGLQAAQRRLPAGRSRHRLGEAADRVRVRRRLRGCRDRCQHRQRARGLCRRLISRLSRRPTPARRSDRARCSRPTT